MYMPLRGRPQSPPLGAAIRGPRVWVQGGTADLPTPAPPPEFKQTPQEEANIAIIKKAHATSLDPAKRAATPGESHDTPLLNAYYSAGKRANLGLFNGRPSQNNAAGATLVPVQLSLMAASVDCQYRNRPATLGGKASIIYSSPAPAAKAFAAAAEAVAPGCLQSMEPMTAVTTAVGSGTLAQTFQTILYIFASHLTLFLLLSQQKGAATTGFPIVQPSADGTGVAVLTDGSPLLQIVAPQMEKSLLTACTVRINFTLAETTMPAGLTSGGRLRFALRSWLSSFLQYRSTAAVPAAKSGSPQWYKTIEQLLLLPELQLLDLLAVADVPGGSGNIADLQFYNPATAAALRAAGAAGLLDDRAGFMTVLLTVVGGGATLLWGILLRGFILPPLAPLLLTLLRELDVFIRSGAAVLQSVLRMEKGAASGLEVQDPRYATAGGRVGTMAELLEWVGGASAAFFSTSGGSLSGVQMAVPVSFLPGDIGTMLAFLAACAARRKPFIVTGMHLSACVARFCSIGGSDALFSLGDQVKQLHGLHTALASMQAIVAVHDGKPLLYVAERMRGPLVDLPVPVRPVLRVKPDRRDQAAGAAWHAERSEVMHVFEEQVKVHAAAQLAATTLHRKVTLTAEYKATLLSAAEVALRPEPPPLQQPAAAAGSPGSPGGLSMFWALLDEASVSGVEDPEARAAAARTAAALADAGREADALKRALAQQTLSSPARPPPARREGQSGAVDTNGPASMLSSPEAALPST